MQLIRSTYEYAGFKYELKYDGVRLWAFPLEGQHPAANKAKHKAAAIKQFEKDW